MKSNKLRLLAVSTAFTLFLTAFMPSSQSSQRVPIKTAVLFLAYDQGESNAFLRIQKKLRQQGIPYRILAMGRAAEVFNEDPALIAVNALTHNEKLRGNRNQPLNQSLVYDIADQVSTRVIYTGMASRAQAQLANVMSRKGARVFAFYDNFEPIHSQSFVRPFMDELKSSAEYHVPSRETARSFTALVKGEHSSIKVTGQPALEAWDEIYQQTDTAKLRKTLNIHPKQTVVLFAGDYSKHYPKAFRTFIRATRLMPDVLFLVTHHPKQSGAFEQRIIHSEARRNVNFLHHGTYSTAVLSTIASAVVVHQSSVAQQALYKGKPVIYVNDAHFQNLILAKGLAERASSPHKLAHTMDSVLRRQLPPLTLSALGIPSRPSLLISQQIQDEINRKTSHNRR